MAVESPTRRSGLVVGLALILLGVAALVVQQEGISVPWPAWIVLVGLGLLVWSIAIGGPGGAGTASAGGIVTMVGVVLAVQRETGLYQTWAYAWALVAPGGVGLGLAVFGLLTGRWHDLRGGLWSLTAGIVIFLVGFLFFEGVIGLSGDRFGQLTRVAVPALLVVLGVVVLLAAIVPGPWHGRPATTGGRGELPATPAGGAGGAPTETLAIGLEGAADAEVMITFGAGRLAIGTAAPGMLVDGAFDGGVRAERAAAGRVRLSPPLPAGIAWDRAPFSWRAGVTAEVPLRLRVEVGAAGADLDLTGLRLADLRLRTGASETRVTLPRAAGLTRVDAEGGAAAVRFIVPDGVAARIRSVMTLGSNEIDATRFPRTADGAGWESPDFASAENRVEIEFRGGVGALSVR